MKDRGPEGHLSAASRSRPARRPRHTDVFTGTGVQLLVPAADRLGKVMTFLDRRRVPAFGAPLELAVRP